ncbi:MAG: hypothetical protein ACKO9Q_17215, partial [Pirellula sp.]
GREVLAIEQKLQAVRKYVRVLHHQPGTDPQQQSAKNQCRTGLEIAANKQDSQRFKHLDEAFHIEEIFSKFAGDRPSPYGVDSGA